MGDNNVDGDYTENAGDYMIKIENGILEFTIQRVTCDDFSYTYFCKSLFEEIFLGFAQLTSSTSLGLYQSLTFLFFVLFFIIF
jgi:hypothetical protein